MTAISWEAPAMLRPRGSHHGGRLTLKQRLIRRNNRTASKPLPHRRGPALLIEVAIPGAVNWAAAELRRTGPRRNARRTGWTTQACAVPVAAAEGLRAYLPGLGAALLIWLAGVALLIVGWSG